jgi:hypothetical protein
MPQVQPPCGGGPLLLGALSSMPPPSLPYGSAASAAYAAGWNAANLYPSGLHPTYWPHLVQAAAPAYSPATYLHLVQAAAPACSPATYNWHMQAMGPMPPGPNPARPSFVGYPAPNANYPLYDPTLHTKPPAHPLANPTGWGQHAFAKPSDSVPAMQRGGGGGSVGQSTPPSATHSLPSPEGDSLTANAAEAAKLLARRTAEAQATFGPVGASVPFSSSRPAHFNSSPRTAPGGTDPVKETSHPPSPALAITMPPPSEKEEEAAAPSVAGGKRKRDSISVASSGMSHSTEATPLIAPGLVLAAAASSGAFDGEDSDLSSSMSEDESYEGGVQGAAGSAAGPNVPNVLYYNPKSSVMVDPHKFPALHHNNHTYKYTDMRLSGASGGPTNPALAPSCFASSSAKDRSRPDVSPAPFGALLPVNASPTSLVAAYHRHMAAFGSAGGEAAANSLIDKESTPGAPVQPTVRRERRIGADRRRRAKLTEAVNSLRRLIVKHGQDASTYDHVSVLYAAVDLIHNFEAMVSKQHEVLRQHEGRTSEQAEACTGGNNASIAGPSPSSARRPQATGTVANSASSSAHDETEPRLKKARSTSTSAKHQITRRFSP